MLRRDTAEARRLRKTKRELMVRRDRQNAGQHCFQETVISMMWFREVKQSGLQPSEDGGGAPVSCHGVWVEQEEPWKDMEICVT